MRNLKFGSNKSSDLTYREKCATVSSPEIKKVAEGFANNLNRALNLYTVPVDAAHWASTFGEFRGQAIWASMPIKEEYLRQHPKPAVFVEFFDLPDTVQTEVSEAASLGYNASVQQRLKQPFCPELSRERANKGWTQGSAVLNWLAEGAPHFHSGLEAILSSVLVGGWSAFEVLASDLWVAAVNARPMTLGEKALKSPKSKTPGRNLSPNDDDVESQNDSIKIDVLKEHGYNLSNKIGTVIYESRKFHFDRLESIASGYKFSFGAPSEMIFSSTPDLPILEALRNVLLHNAGIVDRQFMTRVKSDPKWSGLQRGDTISVDGEIVSQYVNAASRCGVALIEMVDIFLQKNQ